MTVAQQERPVHEVADAGKLVRRDDGRDAVLRRLAHGASDGGGSARMRGVVDEHDLARARRRVPNVRRAGHSQQTRVPEVLDRARIDAPEAGKALEQSGGAGTPSAEDGDALSLVHLEIGGAQHPDSRRASCDAGGVALPQAMGAKGERHDRTMCRALARPTPSRGTPNELSARSALRPMGPEASYATRSARRDVRRFAVQVEGAREIDSVTTLEPPAQAAGEATHLREVTPQQWRD